MTYPSTYATPGVGRTPRDTVREGSPASNPDWVDAFVNYWVARWVNGDHSVPQGWVSALDGEPDDKDGLGNPRTVMAFTRYAMRYKPGMDRNVDQVMPYIPPGPDDYVEDPVVKAARIADEQWQRTFDEGTRQFGLNFDQTERNNLRTAFNNAYQNELTKFATQAGMYNANVQAQMSAYNTQAGIYNNNQNAEGTRLANAGTLAGTLQTLQDARTNKAIELKANPADYVQQAFQTRALNAPQGTQTPAFKDVDALMEVIRRLIDYKPGTPPQAPPVNGGNPLAMPTAPDASTFVSPPGAMGGPNPAPTSPSGPKPAGPLPVVGSSAGSGSGFTPGNPWGSTNPGSGTPGYTPPAGSYSGIRDEDVADLDTAGKWKILRTGLGGPSKASSYAARPDRPYGFHVVDPTSGRQYGDDEDIAPNSSVRVVRYAQGSNPLGTLARKMIVGDPQQDGGPNPELVEVINPGPKTRTRVTPFKRALNLRSKPPMFAAGTDPNNPILTTYDDTVYQNLPHLQYLQGNIGRGAFNQLAKGYATGSLGQRVPEAGQLNYRQYQDVARDPVSLAMLSSDYKSANRDLAGTVARAKARAPFGQALNTTLVRT